MRLGNDRIGLLGVLLVAAISILSALFEDPPSADAPPAIRPPAARAPDASVRRPVPAPVSDDWASLPVISIAVGEKRDSSGTAFAVGDGTWMTARHVVDGCDVVGVLDDRGRGIRARGVTIHPGADVAVMDLARTGPAVRFADSVPRPGDTAYHVGFPRGVPGEMRSRMMGMRVMNVRGRYSTREPVIVWAEIERFPDDSRPLSGLSGGPVFDARGRVIGVHVAGSVRRGRSFTAHPVSMLAVLDIIGAPPPTGDAEPRFTPTTLPRVADDLRSGWTVAKALCDVR